MISYDNLIEALDDLKKRGYTYDFNLKENSIICDELNHELTPNEFTILEMHRFQEMSDVDDEAVIYAVVSKDGKKGTMIDAYGAYAGLLSPEMLKKLSFKK